MAAVKRLAVMEHDGLQTVASAMPVDTVLNIRKAQIKHLPENDRVADLAHATRVRLKALQVHDESLGKLTNKKPAHCRCAVGAGGALQLHLLRAKNAAA